MLSFRNVSKTYSGGSIVALDGVSFNVQKGEFCFLIGPSGAGKSTVIRLLIHQELPTEGSIVFDELEVNALPNKMIPVYRQQLGIVFQDLKLLPNKTVRENIEFILEIRNKDKKEIIELTQYLLETVRLNERANLYPEALSGGEKQRVAIARALANDPTLFIADEPTGNLDPKTSEEILEILKKINSWGTTVLVVTHDKYIVNLMNTRVLKFERGKLVRDEIGGYE